MRRFLIAVYEFLCLFGLDPLKTVRALRGLPSYISDLRALKAQQRRGRGAGFALGRYYPCLTERFTPGGTARGHYFHQDLLVARRVFAARPEKHVDVGSRMDGFVAHVASFREIEVLDIRPLPATIPNVRTRQLDIMAEPPPALLDYCDSLSCLHALEHFGLGRYGDPMDLDGHTVGLRNLARIVRPGGRFYFSVPIGPQRIEFNAHRVFAVATLAAMLGESFRVDAFSYIDDHGDLVENAPWTETGIAHNYGCWYGCGVFELTRLRQEAARGP